MPTTKSTSKSKSNPTPAATRGAAFAMARHRRRARRPRRPGQGRRLDVGGEELKLTNLDKASSTPSHRVTKRDLIRYFARIAPTMLPHLAERPLNLQRFPNGAGAPGFWQKDIPATAPTWLRRWHETGVDGRGPRRQRPPDRRSRRRRCAGSATRRPSRSTPGPGACPNPWRPTFALIDIDPGEKTTWDETLVLARLYRTALGHLGVRGYPKTTGKRGIQVWIPIEPRYDVPRDQRAGSRRSRGPSGRPCRTSSRGSGRRTARKGKARLDYTQNASIKTLVAPYAVRPAPGAPVSAPITWDELDDPDLRPDRWTIRTIVERVAEVGDLFAAAQTDLQVLPNL